MPAVPESELYVLGAFKRLCTPNKATVTLQEIAREIRADSHHDFWTDVFVQACLEVLEMKGLVYCTLTPDGYICFSDPESRATSI